jgi:hypothetical protein
MVALRCERVWPTRSSACPATHRAFQLSLARPDLCTSSPCSWLRRHPLRANGRQMGFDPRLQCWLSISEPRGPNVVRAPLWAHAIDAATLHPVHDLWCIALLLSPDRPPMARPPGKLHALRRDSLGSASSHQYPSSAPSSEPGTLHCMLISREQSRSLSRVRRHTTCRLTHRSSCRAARRAHGAPTARAVRRCAAAHSSPHAYHHRAGGRPSPRPAAELNR